LTSLGIAATVAANKQSKGAGDGIRHLQSDGVARPAKPTAEVFAEVAEPRRVPDELGYAIAWFAEHHFSNYCLCASPLMLVAHCASITKQIRARHLSRRIAALQPGASRGRDRDCRRAAGGAVPNHHGMLTERRAYRWKTMRSMELMINEVRPRVEPVLGPRARHAAE